MHNLIHNGGFKRRTAALSALAMAAGLAGTALLLPGTAHADSTVATSTTITGTTQLLMDPGFPPVLQVHVSVSAQSGTQSPDGTVVVGTTSSDNNTSYTCTASLTSSSSGTSTGSCQLRNMPFGSYLLHAGYGGSGTFGKSSAADAWAAVGQAPKLTADSPPLTADRRSYYSYTFAASGVPAPVYHLSADSPSWLNINQTTGHVYGWIPWTDRSFTFSVVASNAVGKAAAGPFTVSVGSSQATVATSVSCPQRVAVGQQGSCTLTIKNTGSTVAHGVDATLALPRVLHARACYLGWGWSWGRGPSCTLDHNTATWHVGRLWPGQTKQFIVQFNTRFVFLNARFIKVTVTGAASWDNGQAAYSSAKVFVYKHRWGWGWGR